MEHIKNAVLQASTFFKAADHMAFVSYPLLKENKLLMVISKNLYMSGLRGIDAMLYYDRMYKRISFMPSDLDSRLILFETDVAPRHSIKPDVFKVIRELRFIVQQQRDSPVEFSRGAKYVICNYDYSIVKTVDIAILKSYILIMRNFLHIVSGIVGDVRGQN